MKRVGSLPDVEGLRRRDPFSKIRSLREPSDADRGIGVEEHQHRSPLASKLLVALAVPLLPVYAYALWRLFDAALLLAYLLVLMLYALLVGAYVRPPPRCPPPHTPSSQLRGVGGVHLAPVVPAVHTRAGPHPPRPA